MTTAVESVKDLSFETAMSELEALVRRLEEGQYSLEEALTAYEKGSALKSLCEEKLRQAKLRVDKITVNEEGASNIEPFDGEQTP